MSIEKQKIVNCNNKISFSLQSILDFILHANTLPLLGVGDMETNAIISDADIEEIERLKK